MAEGDGVRIDAAVPGRGVEVDLTLPGGTTTALVGPNGAGKSTLVQLLDGRLRPARGSVAVAGRVLSDDRSNVPTHRRPIALLQQRPVLFDHLDVLGNVAFGPRARGASRRDARARAERELDLVGASELASRRPTTLSGGQAQRVALARALATDPSVLLLDEPFAALDVGAAAILRRVLADRLSRTRPTTLLVTHDPLDIWALASRLVCLEAGRVTAQGEVTELLARPTTGFLADLCGANLLQGRREGSLVRVDDQLVAGLWEDDADGGTGAALAVFDPSAVALHTQRPGGSPRNAWPVVVVGLEPRGATVRVRLELAGGQGLAADLTAQGVSELSIAPGHQLFAQVKATQVMLRTRPSV